jgi:3-oxoacyl-[acyl-carrier-protein] synthase-3
MATRIESVATSHPRGRRLGRSALHLSDVAAEMCLARAHRDPSELDLLVNVGLYKDHSIAEPALASIIQEDVGANPSRRADPGRHGTFSFDLVNGGVGMLTAAELIDGFVGDGPAHLGLIVAGDADPAPRSSLGFPFAPAGGAVLLGHTDDGAGFVRFRFRTFPADAPLFESSLVWDPEAGIGRRGRNRLEVRVAPSFAARAAEHGGEVARALLDEVGLAAAEVDLLVTSQVPASFAAEIARDLGIPEAHVPRVAPELARAHTAGPIAALDAASRSGQLASARHILFVAVGAGITVGAALYRTRRP